MNDFKSYPRYQFSLFVGKGGQVVVRTDSAEEFKKLVQEVNYTFSEDVAPSKPVTPIGTSEVNIKNAKCDVLNCTYDKFYRNEKDGKSWYSHKGKDGKYHNLKV